MDKKVIVVDKMHDSMGKLLRNKGFQLDYQPQIKRHEIIDQLAGCVGLIIRSKTYVDKELLKNADQLKFVGRAGAGMDNIDIDYLAQKGIFVVNAPEGNRDALGEHTIGMLLTLLHKINFGNSEIHKKVWNREKNRGIELKGKTVGIFGYGFMGSAFAEKLSGFDCRVIAFDKFKVGFGNKHVEEVDFNTFKNETEILSIHVPLTIETSRLIDKKFLNLFENLIVIINTSRGDVLVLKDLIDYLNKGKLVGVCLDVLENEKFDQLTDQQHLDLDQLIGMSNVIITPHVAGWTNESYQRINEVLIDKISKLNL